MLTEDNHSFFIIAWRLGSPMREPLEDRYEGFRRKEYEPLGYLSKLFPSLIPLSVATTLRRKTLVTADGLTKEMCVSVYLYAKEVKRLYIRRQGLCSLAYTIILFKPCIVLQASSL